jgi:hypothetical protein
MQVPVVGAKVLRRPGADGNGPYPFMEYCQHRLPDTPGCAPSQTRWGQGVAVQPDWACCTLPAPNCRKLTRPAGWLPGDSCAKRRTSRGVRGSSEPIGPPVGGGGGPGGGGDPPPPQPEPTQQVPITSLSGRQVSVCMCDGTASASQRIGLAAASLAVWLSPAPEMHPRQVTGRNIDASVGAFWLISPLRLRVLGANVRVPASATIMVPPGTAAGAQPSGSSLLMFTVAAHGITEIRRRLGTLMASNAVFTKRTEAARRLVKRVVGRPSRLNIEPVLSRTIAISTQAFVPEPATDTTRIGIVSIGSIPPRLNT